MVQQVRSHLDGQMLQRPLEKLIFSDIITFHISIGLFLLMLTYYFVTKISNYFDAIHSSAYYSMFHYMAVLLFDQFFLNLLLIRKLMTLENNLCGEVQ